LCTRSLTQAADCDGDGNIRVTLRLLWHGRTLERDSLGRSRQDRRQRCHTEGATSATAHLKLGA
jgi:hypothetical protein